VTMWLISSIITTERKLIFLHLSSIYFFGDSFVWLFHLIYLTEKKINL